MTAGAITQHAQFKLAQLESMARATMQDVTRLQTTLDDITARFAGCADSSTWEQVRVAKENLERAQAHHDGAKLIYNRERAKMQDPAHLASLAELDALEEQVAATDFGAVFASEIGPEIDAIASKLVALIAKTRQLVSDNGEPICRLIEKATDMGMRELFANKQPLSQNTGECLFREALLRSLNTAGKTHRVDGLTIAVCTGVK